MIWRHLIVLLFLSVGTVLPTPLSQWDYRITGRIPVELPAVKTGTYQRPPVRLEIPRTERDVCEPGRIAIKLRTTYPSEAVRQRLQLFGTRQMVPLLDKQTHSALQQQALDLNRIFIAHFDAGFDPFDVAAALMELPDIEYACPLYIRRTFRQPNDPLFPQQSALARIQMPSAWDVTLGSPDVVIAIIDSGTDYEHEDLSANLWTNPGETGTDPQGRDKRTNGIDDDGNGKIDDWRGWDFVGNVTRNEYLAGTVREDNDPKVRTTMTEEMQHGTYSAGAAIAVTDNSRGIASPAGFRCRFLPIKCGSDDPSLAGSVLRGYEAILYAARLGAAVINCSWGGPGASPLEQQIIDQAHTLGALVIASAGNESVDLEQQPLYPACYAGVFAVGATAATSDQVASFSNTGAPVAAYAPGVSIRTTRSNNAYTAVEGTSFSAPLVSGVAALVRSLHPNWTAEQVAAQLRYTCDQITGISGSQRWQFYGRINAARALSVNRSFDSGERIPGVRAIAATVNGSTTIVNQEGTLQIRLRNLLATARDVRVQLSVSSNATVGQTQLTASNLGTLEERTVETTIRLGTPLYFFDGTVTVSLTITADGIVEYATFALPIALTTTNVYTRLASQQPHSFVAVATRGLAGIWAIGRTPSGRALVYRSNGSISDSTSLSGTLTTLAIVSNATVCIGTENGMVWRTTDAGSSWRSASVSSITPSVDGIVFFDANTGICIGRPSGGSWRIGRTADGGNTWSVGALLPAPLSNERTTHHAIATLGDTIWFGTSTGRIFRSTDRGATWTNVSAATTDRMIVSVAFSSRWLGYCVARHASSATTSEIYRTTDGGTTWQPTGAVFQRSSLDPIALYAPQGAQSVFAMCSGAQVLRTLDSGSTWQPVLTGNGGTITAGSGTTTGQNALLTMAGRTIATLRISIAPTRPIVRLSPSDTLDVGSVRLDSSARAVLTVSNVGGASLTISALHIEPIMATDSEFVVESTTPLSVAPNSARTVSVRFIPRSSGQRLARLRIVTNTDPAEYTLIIRGTGIEPSTVETTSEHRCTVFAFGEVLTIACPCTELVTITLWQSDGRMVGTYVAEPLAHVRLDATSLPAGAYFYRTECTTETSQGMFLLLH